MDEDILGLHHVTAIASDPNRNIAFYTTVLGLKLVKITVNFDDPGSYHFYYGDEIGRPGSLLTFFLWPDAPRGRRGPGQVTVVKFGIPFGSMPFWADRLRRYQVIMADSSPLFDEEALIFSDPDALQLELIEVGELRTARDEHSPIPHEYAITHIHGVTLLEPELQATDSLLTGTLGFRRMHQEPTGTRYRTGHTLVDLVHTADKPRGFVSVGTVHHVAWRIADQEQQRDWREQLVGKGLSVTPIIDRRYFKSIYFREPGGVLFELATDPPGFTIDEEVDELGTRLVLPPWLESVRNRIEARLPRLTVPKFESAA